YEQLASADPGDDALDCFTWVEAAGFLEGKLTEKVADRLLARLKRASAAEDPSPPGIAAALGAVDERLPAPSAAAHAREAAGVLAQPIGPKASLALVCPRAIALAKVIGPLGADKSAVYLDRITDALVAALGAGLPAAPPASLHACLEAL